MPAHMPSMKGSSPLTRGKHGFGLDAVMVRGIIPAHAGKTGGLRFELSHISGSSPLTRGKPRDGETHPLRDGIIPAHAGKTTRGLGAAGSWRDHPRSRGENRGVLARSFNGLGSSPLTRGKHSHSVATPVLIPDHPRSRGENLFGHGQGVGREGSSPLTRGKRINRHFAFT